MRSLEDHHIKCVIYLDDRRKTMDQFFLILLNMLLNEPIIVFHF